jgi:hypothetical protein
MVQCVKDFLPLQFHLFSSISKNKQKAWEQNRKGMYTKMLVLLFQNFSKQENRFILNSLHFIRWF